MPILVHLAIRKKLCPSSLRKFRGVIRFPAVLAVILSDKGKSMTDGPFGVKRLGTGVPAAGAAGSEPQSVGDRYRAILQGDQPGGSTTAQPGGGAGMADPNATPSSGPWNDYREPSYLGGTAKFVPVSPIVLLSGYLLMRAIAIRSRPEGMREQARRSLGVWARLMIVLSMLWSALLTGLLLIVTQGQSAELNTALVLWTFGPIIALWLIYFAARWVRQGAN